MRDRSNWSERGNSRAVLNIRRLKLAVACNQAMLAAAQETAKHLTSIIRENLRIENERRASLGIPPLPCTDEDDPT